MQRDSPLHIARTDGFLRLRVLSVLLLVLPLLPLASCDELVPSSDDLQVPRFSCSPSSATTRNNHQSQHSLHTHDDAHLVGCHSHTHTQSGVEVEDDLVFQPSDSGLHTHSYRISGQEGTFESDTLPHDEPSSSSSSSSPFSCSSHSTPSSCSSSSAPSSLSPSSTFSFPANWLTDFASIPPLISSTDPSSFSHYTLNTRLTNVVRACLTRETKLSDESRARLRALLEDIPLGFVRSLADERTADILKCSAEPHFSDWRRWTCEREGKETWTDIVPGIIMEMYFYRRVLEAAGYCSPGAKPVDPYEDQKSDSLREALPRFQDALDYLHQNTLSTRQQFEFLMRLGLFANQGDLSMTTSSAASSASHPASRSSSSSSYSESHASTEHASSFSAKAVLSDDFLLASDIEAIWQALQAHFASHPARSRFDIITDNVGLEFMADLALVDFMLTNMSTVGFHVNHNNHSSSPTTTNSTTATSYATFHIHLKNHPTFVSDVTRTDMEHTLAAMLASSHLRTRQLAARVQEHARAGRVVVESEEFWTLPRYFWEMDSELVANLSESDMVFSKGDATYRRLLGDRQWPHTTPLSPILRYFPAPLALIRTNKAEIVAGLAPSSVERAVEKAAADWLTSGQWGVIQFCPNKQQ